MDFDAGKTAQLTHLKSARRRYKKSINPTGAEESKEKDRKEYAAHALLKVGEKNKQQDSGYDADKGILQEPKELAGAILNLRTKDVRGKSKKTIAMEFELNFAQNMHQGKITSFAGISMAL